jgi:hypothetical protein
MLWAGEHWLFIVVLQQLVLCVVQRTHTRPLLQVGNTASIENVAAQVESWRMQTPCWRSGVVDRSRTLAAKTLTRTFRYCDAYATHRRQMQQPSVNYTCHTMHGAAGTSANDSKHQQPQTAHRTISLRRSRVGEPSASRPLLTNRCSRPSAAVFSNLSGSKSSLR